MYLKTEHAKVIDSKSFSGKVLTSSNSKIGSETSLSDSIEYKLNEKIFGVTQLAMQ